MTSTRLSKHILKSRVSSDSLSNGIGALGFVVVYVVLNLYFFYPTIVRHDTRAPSSPTACVHDTAAAPRE